MIVTKINVATVMSALTMILMTGMTALRNRNEVGKNKYMENPFSPNVLSDGLRYPSLSSSMTIELSCNFRQAKFKKKQANKSVGPILLKLRVYLLPFSVLYLCDNL